MISELLDRLVADHPELRAVVSEARGHLARLEQRETELAALNEAARDLTRIRDVDHTLQAVVDRTRRLLRSDVSYLSARTDEEEHFAVRAWAGPLSPAFLGTRVSVGTGVGGQVAATRRPFQVEDYRDPDAFSHSDYLDAHVSAEGLVALLGVPVEVDGRLLGILFAGRRRRERFSPDQVELMSSLGAHAAVALDNALLFLSQKQAVAELEEAATLLRAHTAAVETSAEVHGRLTGIVLRGDGVATILQAVSEALGGSLTMVDDAGAVLARHGERAPEPPFVPEVQQALRASREAGRAQVVGDFDARQWCVSAASTGSRYLGALVVATPGRLTEIDRRTVERATQTIAISMLSDLAAAEADARAEGDALRRLLDDSRATGHDARHLARRHALVDRGISVAVAPSDSRRAPQQLAALRALCAETGGLSAQYADQLVALLPVPAEQALDRFARTVESAGRVRASVAVAWAEHGHGTLGGAHLEATHSLTLLGRLGRDGEHVLAEELAPYALLLAPGSAHALDRFLARTVGPLLEHDGRHTSGLATTALAYLDAACSLSGAARALGVHVNTVSQRLNRIDRILGAQWRDSRHRLDVHHALRLVRLRDRDRREHAPSEPS